MSVKVELQTDEQNWKSQAETYLDTTISSLSKRKKQLEDDLAYVQEELQKQRSRKEQKTQPKQDAVATEDSNHSA